MDEIPAEESFMMGIRLLSRQVHFGGNVSMEYVKLAPNSNYRPHYHERSDALVFILDGSGHVLNGDGNSYKVSQGSVAYFPRRTRHGFATESEGLNFLAVQSPPIKDALTGREDFVE